MNIKEWLNNNQMAIDIWERKYQFNNESFEEWLDRVSGGNNNIRQIIVDKKFLFAGRILSNRGLDKTGKKITLSNCYVLEEPEDNLESIFNTASKLARTFSYGGGCGIDIGNLRPKNSVVNNAAQTTSGSVSFMDLYNLTTELIGQAGRRGALMISIPCNHPDIEEFIELKSDLDKVTKANISIRITHDFMEAVKNKAKYQLYFKIMATGEEIIKKVNAYDVFKKLCEMNWDYAEPGMLYWDKIEKWNLLSDTPNFKFAGTNPCAEEPLPAGGSCLLGSLNLSEFVQDDKFNFEDFTNTIRFAVVGLNEVLDEGLPLHPLQEQRDSVRDWRQIGLGLMGLADMLIKLKIEYGSQESLDLCNDIGKVLIRESFKASIGLGESLGSFPMFNKENIISTDFYKTHLSDIECNTLRNSQLLTIAPTGTLSTMLGISGGIEPIFANYYERKTVSLHEKEKTYKVFTPIVKQYFNENNLNHDEKLLPNYFITSQNLNYKNRIDMQSVWQHYIDASISSTVNVPNKFTVEETMDLYMYAYDKGLKGITIYRDGCKRSGVLTTNMTKEEVNSELPRGMVINTDNDVIGKKRSLTTGCGTLHCTAFFDKVSGELMETYFSKGSTGGCNNFMTGLSRMTSLCARAGVDIEDIVDQLNSSGSCPSYSVRAATKRDTSKGASCPISIGYALLDMYNEMQDDISDDYKEIEIRQVGNRVRANFEIDGDIKVNIRPLCPQCKNELIFEGGCNSCKACGYSKCD